MKKGTSKQEIIPVAFLTIVVCMSVIFLYTTNSVTEEYIEKSKNEAVNAMLNEQFSEMDDYSYDEKLDLYTVFLDDEIIGYAFVAVASGYGGPIELIVALESNLLQDDEIIIHGISVVSHSETPGLGEKIVEASFSGQFTGINVKDVALSKDGGKIDAISGATISSSAVVNTVFNTVKEKARIIRENINSNIEEES